MWIEKKWLKIQNGLLVHIVNNDGSPIGVNFYQIGFGGTWLKYESSVLVSWKLSMAIGGRNKFFYTEISRLGWYVNLCIDYVHKNYAKWIINN